MVHQEPEIGRERGFYTLELQCRLHAHSYECVGLRIWRTSFVRMYTPSPTYVYVCLCEYL